MGKIDYSKVFAALELEKTVSPGKKQIIDTLKERGALLAVKGSWDYLEDVVPYCYAAEKLLLDPEEPMPDLEKYAAILLGCPGRIEEKSEQAIKNYVERGGYLVTTDWALRTVEGVFPGYISESGNGEGDY